jgi:hypothetical protein
MIAWCVTTDAGRTVRCAASKDAACDKTYVGRVCSEAPPQTAENSVAETAPLHCRLCWLCPAPRGLDISEGWHSGLETCFIRYDLGLRRCLDPGGRVLKEKL